MSATRRTPRNRRTMFPCPRPDVQFKRYRMLLGTHDFHFHGAGRVDLRSMNNEPSHIHSESRQRCVSTDARHIPRPTPYGGVTGTYNIRHCRRRHSLLASSCPYFHLRCTMSQMDSKLTVVINSSPKHAWKATKDRLGLRNLVFSWLRDLPVVSSR